MSSFRSPSHLTLQATFTGNELVFIYEVCQTQNEVPYRNASRPIVMLPNLKVHSIANPAGFLNNQTQNPEL